MTDPPDATPRLLAWLGLPLAISALTALLGWRRPRLRRLLQPQEPVGVPWSGVEVAVVVIGYFLWPILFFQLLTAAGFFAWYYGLDPAVPAPTGLTLREQLWAVALALPFQVVTVLGVLRLGSDTRPYHLGLTARRLGPDVVLGVGGAVVLIPWVYLLNVLVEWSIRVGFGTRPEPHPLLKVAQEGPAAGEWLLLLFTALVAAPVLEELLFRGVLQRWLGRHPLGSDLAVAAALYVAVMQRWSQLQQTWTLLPEQGPGPLLRELAPALFVLVVGLPPLLLWRGPSAGSGRNGTRRPGLAVYATALLFGATHSFAWPTPIPLFVLGLALGSLAQRTQSLVGAMVLHMLFNATACVVLVVQAVQAG